MYFLLSRVNESSENLIFFVGSINFKQIDYKNCTEDFGSEISFDVETIERTVTYFYNITAGILFFSWHFILCRQTDYFALFPKIFI